MSEIRIGFQVFTPVEEFLPWCNSCQKFAVPRCYERRNKKRCKVSEISTGMMGTVCPKCSRSFHVHNLTVEANATIEHRILCMCCQWPEHWEWKRFPDGTEKLVERETPRRRLDVERDRLYMPGELEKQQLREKQLQLTSALTRLPELQKALVHLTAAIEKTKAEIEMLPAEIETLESLVSAALTDPLRETKFKERKKEARRLRLLRDERMAENMAETMRNRGPMKG